MMVRSRNSSVALGKFTMEKMYVKERILKEYIKGDTIFDYVLRTEVEPDFVEQMKEMCVVLYAANKNIDYFPTNFVVQEDKLYYIDYECNDYMEKWNFENWGIKYWSQTKEFLEYVNRYLGNGFLFH